MDSANHQHPGNISIGIRVVSPDRPTKNAVAIVGTNSENPCGAERSCGPKHGSSLTDTAAASAVNENCSAALDNQQESVTKRRNSSIGLSLLLGEETNDTISTHPQQQQQQQGYPSSAYHVATMYNHNNCNNYNNPMIEQRDNCPGAVRPSRNGSNEEQAVPLYRPLVGSGAAAAYEALRHDYYVQKYSHSKAQRRMSSLSFGSAKAGRGCGGGDDELLLLDEALLPKDIARPAQDDEQFEMLKVHYYNLVNEIQETAMMLNICEQHQIMLEQQQQQAAGGGSGVGGQHHLPCPLPPFPGGPEPAVRSGGAKRPVPTDGSFEISVPTCKIVRL